MRIAPAFYLIGSLVLASSQGTIDLKDVQGDIIIGLQKRVEAFHFITFKDAKEARDGFRRVLKNVVAPMITSTEDVNEKQAMIQVQKLKDFKARSIRTLLDISHINIGFTATGLQALGLSDAEIPTGVFKTGQHSDAIQNLGDPTTTNSTGQRILSSWSSDYLNHPIHCIFIITAPSRTSLDAKLSSLQTLLGSFIKTHFTRYGAVRPGVQAGHEHFGFRDSISTPKLSGINARPQDVKAGVVDPSVILITNQNPPNSALAWTQHGSFMVFRELQQMVPEFDEFCKRTAFNNQTQSDILRANLVGRWKSGAPVTLSPTHDDSTLATSQDFDYSDDLQQERCPYVAHIRKTNPRNGIAGINSQLAVLPHLMVRNGIPYGPEVSEEEEKSGTSLKNRGLLFVCYQSRIEDGFQFVQKLWSNNPNFPNNPLGITPGFDLIIGQTKSQLPRISQGLFPNGDRTDSNNTVTAMSQFVNPLGGEYFFLPSLSALKNKLGL